MINIQFENFNNQFNTRIRRTPGYFIQILLFVLCALIFTKIYKGYRGDFRPQGVHSWAQSDRLSIALNYYDNGLDFFEPRTNYLEYSNGKTGVEFPIVQYLSALIAKPFGARNQIFLIYRILSFLLLCAALQFLLLTIRIHGGNGFQQILIPLFFLLSPVIMFYGFNFLPDIPSFSFILMSYYYFEKYRIKLSFNSIYYAIILGCIGTLLKTTSAIFPFAYLLWFLIDALFIEKQLTRRQILQVLSAFILSFGMCISITFFFTIKANAVYKSSVFLSMSRHINQWSDFGDIWRSLVCWHREYFRETQYWVLLFSLIVALNPRFRQKGVLLFKGILIVGMICFVLLMGKQLMDHDYYAICTIIPFALVLCIDGLMVLSQGCFGGIILLYIVQNLAPQSLLQSKNRQAELYALPCKDVNDYKGYMKEGADWLTKNKIPRTHKVFIFYDFPLNTPLVYLDRKGMVFNHFKMKDIKLIDFWLNYHKPELILIPIQWNEKLKTDRPDIFKKLEPVYQGKEVLIFKYPFEYLAFDLKAY